MDAMRYWSGLFLLCIGLLGRLSLAQLGGSGDSENLLDAVPATCRASPHVLRGTQVKWQLLSGRLVDGDSCSFTTGESTLNSSSFTTAPPGDYRYECPDMGVEGNMTIVQAQYSIAVCRGCSDHGYRLNPGEVVQWSFVQGNSRESVKCSTELWKDATLMATLDPAVRSHQFIAPGTYQIICQEDNSLNVTVVVMDTSSAPPSRLLPLLYTHAALMAAAFGFLLPLGAFLAYNKAKLAHKVIQPVGLVLALIGLVLVVVYVQLSNGLHFRYLIHSVVGLVLLLMALGMPLLLLKKPRVWHKKTGQVVVFFGMGNVLLGLGVFPVGRTAALVICAVYGLWLLAALGVYIFVPRSSKKVSSYSLNNPKTREMEEVGNHTRNSSFSSLKGPQRLEKNIISDDKMVQLRKKSMDFLESTRQREQLNMQFMNHPLYNRPFDGGDYYSEERRGSKPDQESEFEDLENSRVPLCRMTSQPDSSFPPTPEGELGTDEKVRMFLANSDDKDQSMDEFDDRGRSTDDLDDRGQSTDDLDERGQSTEDLNTTVQSADEVDHDRARITRAQTFNAHHPTHLAEEVEKGGSLRITRHSRRARQGTNDVFPRILPEDSEPSTINKVASLPVHMASTPTSEGTGRRRKGAFVPPPIITTTPVETTDSALPTGCPFNSGLSVGNGNRGASPRPGRRGISPTPSGDSVFDSTPRPMRKKKVSVAQIEATVVPPTPVNLLPPTSTLTRSTSQDTLRTHHDVFTDNAFRSVMQISQDAIVCANSVGDIVFWSVGASRMFGYTPGEAIGSNLEMIVPLSFREKHRSGIAKRTGDTLKYLRKHSYAPEEQKHARLYEVRALTKSGHEIPAEVHVTSFVIEGELFYTGVITEMSRKGGGSIGSTSDINELSLKQRALAVGAQMKMAHNLMNTNYISKKELERVLVTSLRATDFEVESYQIEQMVLGIMKEGDPDSSGVVSFMNLIKLLSKHQLYISESGNIARYGKTKGPQGEDVTRAERAASRMKEFFVQSASSLLWLLAYLLLNLVLFALGVASSEGTGIRRVAYGAGPVLSCNCVIVLLPTLSSVVTAMRGSVWMNKYLPLTRTTLMHVIISCGILFWSLFHITLHLVTFALHSDQANTTTLERFSTNVSTHLFPIITGLIAAAIFLLMALSSIGPVRKLMRFLPFTVIHWTCLLVFYLFLLVHGVHYYSPSFWKWLLPFAVLVIVERVYRYKVVPRHSVKVKSAGRYDDQSRTAIIELEKPSRFKFEPGQFILINLPWIDHFNWQPCQISSGPKDQKLTIHLPYSSEPWLSQAFSYLKKHPYHMPSSSKQGRAKNKDVYVEVTDGSHPADHEIQFSGPYGPAHNSQLLFDYKISTLVCAGEGGPHCAKAIVKKFLEYRKGSSCHCGCTPLLARLYFIWVVPSGNDFEWFTDYLSELCEDEHVHRYLDVRVFLTNINSPPDELASALLQLGIKTAGPHCIVRRPSQPQLNNLHSKTSYGVPDFPALLDYISAQNAAVWSEGSTEFGVFTLGTLHHAMRRDLANACRTSSKPGQLQYTQHHIHT